VGKAVVWLESIITANRPIDREKWTPCQLAHSQHRSIYMEARQRSGLRGRITRRSFLELKKDKRCNPKNRYILENSYMQDSIITMCKIVKILCAT
jgi:hypothetical protein